MQVKGWAMCCCHMTGEEMVCPAWCFSNLAWLFQIYSNNPTIYPNDSSEKRQGQPKRSPDNEACKSYVNRTSICNVCMQHTYQIFRKFGEKIRLEIFFMPTKVDRQVQSPEHSLGSHCVLYNSVLRCTVHVLHHDSFVCDKYTKSVLEDSSWMHEVFNNETQRSIEGFTKSSVGQKWDIKS